MPAEEPGGHDDQVDEPIDATPLPTCPDCGATRSRGAVPYAFGGDELVTYTCTGCGAQFESWRTGDQAPA
jgi:hypothetical protein